MVIVAVVVLSVITQRGKLFKPDYHYNSKQPYGSKVFVEWLKNYHPVSVSKSSLQALADSTTHPVTLVITDDHFDPDSTTIGAMHSLLSRGSTLLVCATGFGNRLLERMSVADGYMYNGAMPIYRASDTTRAITDSSLLPGIQYSLQDSALFAYKMDTTPATANDTIIWKSVLVGGKETSYIIAARSTVGSGTLILCTAPQLLTNYGMLYDRLWNATEVLTSYLPDGPVLWDEHYKPEQLDYEQRSRLDLIGAYKGLTLAYWILLGGLALYLVVAGRRRQRPIPILQPVKAYTLEFIETISALYWMRRDNTVVAQQMLTQFKKQVHRKHRITISDRADEPEQHLAAASGAPLEVVRSLVAMCRMPLPEKMSDDALLELSKQIETFFAFSKT